MKSAGQIPSFVHHALWAYDSATLDLDRDKQLIITQILNRGGAKAIHWLRETYSDGTIAAVVQSPARGLWFPQVLNFWAMIYGLTIPSDSAHRAAINLDPYR